MKCLLATLLLIPSFCHGAPYLVLPWHPDFIRQVNQEACFNPNAGVLASCTSTLIAEHPGHGHGWLLIPGLDWAVPVGFSTNFQPGSVVFATGLSVNLLPAMKGAMLEALDFATKEGTWENLKAMLEPPKEGKPDLTVNVGIKWGIAPQQAWKGYFLLSVGPALKF